MSEGVSVEANRAHWNDRTAIHVASRYYGLDDVRRSGPRRIFGPDEDEVGDVAGKRLLHLQCHIGTDSLRWAALGAEVVGVDISDAAIEAATGLATEVGLSVTFLRSDVADLPHLLDGEFDVVYASYGVICWVPDMWAWSRVAAGFVAPGGFLYLAEGHPIEIGLAAARHDRSGYFDTGGRQYDNPSTYTDGPATITASANHRWHHTLGDVVSAIAASGLRIEFLHENAWSEWQRDPSMVQDDFGRWHSPGAAAPSGFSIKARQS